MKKTLVAVAAVVAATGAIAGNSVTLYGVADAYVGALKAKGGGVTDIVVNSGGAKTSRLGIKVKEDLGGGMYAAVKIEEKIVMDDGGRDAREHWVGLGGDFGEVRLGLNDNSINDVEDFIDASHKGTGFSALTGAMGVWADGAVGKRDVFGGRLSNSIRYVSPDFDGFYGSATLGMGEDKASGKSATRNFGAMLAYEGGPFGIAAGYGLVDQDGSVDPYNVKVGAYYDFGDFLLNGGAALHDPDSNADARTGAINIGGAFTVDNIYVAASLGYAKHGDERSTSFGLEGRYNLSKRTVAYAGFTHGKNKGSKAGHLIAVGMLHAF